MKTKHSKAQPITAHRLFPVIVALWFAALFGTGSFVVPVEMLEKLVAATGLPKLVPAAAPPLGFTARALVALALTGLGALAGVLIALRLRGGSRFGEGAEAKAPRGRFVRSRKRKDTGEGRRRARDLHPDAPVRRPVAAREDLSDIEPLGEPAFETSTGPVRRRPLRLPEDEQAGFAVREHAVLPQGEAHRDEVRADLGPPPFAVPIEATLFAEVEPVPVAEDVSPAIAQPPARDFAPEVANPEIPAVVEPAFEPLAEPAQFAQVAPARSGEEAQEGPEPAPERSFEQPPFAAAVTARAAGPVAGRPVDELGTVQLVERLAMAMAARRERAAAQVAPGASEPHPAFAASIVQDVAAIAVAPAGAPDIEPQDTSDIEPEEAPAVLETFDASEAVGEPLPPAAINDLEPVDLAEFEVDVDPELAAIVPPVKDLPIEVPPIEAPADRLFDRPAAGAPAPVVPLRPAALEPAVTRFEDDEEDGEQPAQLQRFLGGTSPVAREAAAVGAVDAADTEAEYEDVDDEDDRYPSLLGMSRQSGRSEFVRIEEPEAADDGEVEPVVVFPGQGARGAAPFAPPPSPPLVGAKGFDAPPAARPAPAANPEETDRALRAALATLQRMTSSR